MFSVAWTRVMPARTGIVNQAGLDFYERLVDELLKHKIEPYICLFNWDLPQALQDKGGWPNRDTSYAFMDAILNRAMVDPLLKGISPIQDFAIRKLLAGPRIKPGDLEKRYSLICWALIIMRARSSNTTRNFRLFPAPGSNRNGLSIPACGNSIPSAFMNCRPAYGKIISHPSRLEKDRR